MIMIGKILPAPLLLCVFFLAGCSGPTAIPEIQPTQQTVSEDTSAAENGNKLVSQSEVPFSEAVQEEEAAPEADVLLTAPPSVSLTDCLSSRYQDFQLTSDSSSWTYKKGNESLSTIACGFSPLDGVSKLPELAVPEYNQMDQVLYILGCAVVPDQIRIKSWPLEAVGLPDTEPLAVSCDNAMIPLEKGRIYELILTWQEDKLSQRQFAGEASYVFQTK